MLLLLITLVFTTLASDCEHGSFELCTSNKCNIVWDLVLLVATWPGYFCTTKCCDMPSSVNAIKSGFTMHGWWPSFSSGSMTACCNYQTNRTYVEKLVESNQVLLENVAYNWPSLSKCQFVLYEYDKHGVCLGNVYDDDNGPVDYINSAIKLLNQANAWKVFSENGVIADGVTKYSKAWLKELMKEQLGVEDSVYFRCSGDYVSEMRYCTNVYKFDKYNPFFQKCTSQLLKKDNCGDDVIFYPEPVLDNTGCPY
ncbi:Extracellular ribonuclease LE [Entamoeba marina]